MLSPKQAVKQIAQENFSSYEKDWITGQFDLKELADGFWDNRTELEIERDNKEKVKSNDYFRWVEEAFIYWYPTGLDGSELEIITKQKYDEYTLLECIENDPKQDLGYGWGFKGYEESEHGHRAVFVK